MYLILNKDIKLHKVEQAIASIIFEILCSRTVDEFLLNVPLQKFLTDPWVINLQLRVCELLISRSADIKKLTNKSECTIQTLSIGRRIKTPKDPDQTAAGLDLMLSLLSFVVPYTHKSGSALESILIDLSGQNKFTVKQLLEWGKIPKWNSSFIINHALAQQEEDEDNNIEAIVASGIVRSNLIIFSGIPAIPRMIEECLVPA